MTNRLISILIVLQVVTLVYLFVGDRADTKNTVMQTDSDTKELLATVRALQSEIRKLKSVTKQNNSRLLTQNETVEGPDVNDREQQQNSDIQSETQKSRVKLDTQEVLAESNTVVETAISRKRWESNDSLALMRLAPGLSRAEKNRILNEIAEAVNNQQLSLDASLPPL